jgi:hypothetical protein
MAIALASPGPIQIGRSRSPPLSLSMTTGVFDDLSSPRLATVTSVMELPLVMPVPFYVP